MNASPRLRNRAGLAYALLLGALFGKQLIGLFLYAAGSDLHSHIVLVPAIAAYLLAIKRHRLPPQGPPSLLLGSFLAVLGAGALVLQWTQSLGVLSQNDSFALMAFSFVCCLAAGGFFFFGTRWMIAADFSVVFLLFLIPLPDAVANWLETCSKIASAEVSAWLFALIGTPVYREGLIFRLPNIVIEVAQECSGIRSSWVLFITSLLASNLFLATGWRRALLVAFVIPLGVIRNGFRIVVIGWLCVHYGPEMIDSVIHRRGGPVFFVMSLIPMLLLLVWLRSRELQNQARTSSLLST